MDDKTKNVLEVEPAMGSELNLRSVIEGLKRQGELELKGTVTFTPVGVESAPDSTAQADDALPASTN